MTPTDDTKKSAQARRRADERAVKLRKQLRKCLSPHACAAMASYLQSAAVNDPGVHSEILWFTETLTDLVGGWEAQNRLAEEVGL